MACLGVDANFDLLILVSVRILAVVWNFAQIQQTTTILLSIYWQWFYVLKRSIYLLLYQEHNRRIDLQVIGNVEDSITYNQSYQIVVSWARSCKGVNKF